MSLLTLLSGVAAEINIAAPSTIIGNTNREIRQLLQLAQNEGKQLASRYRWQAIKRESTFTSVATESQGEMTTLAGADFGWVANETFWNRTQNRPLFPVTDVQWQQMKSSQITGPYEYFRIRGGELLVIPIMTAGETCAFEWVSKNWCESSGGTAQSAWAADTDTGLIDEDIMAAGVLWRWKKAKGLDYAQDFDTYERLLADAATRDGAKPRLNMGSGMLRNAFLDRRSVSEGGWTL